MISQATPQEVSKVGREGLFTAGQPLLVVPAASYVRLEIPMCPFDLKLRPTKAKRKKKRNKKK